MCEREREQDRAHLGGPARDEHAEAVDQGAAPQDGLDPLWIAPVKVEDEEAAFGGVSLVASERLRARPSRGKET